MGYFPTTRWSVVLAARQHETPGAKEALETLCRIYWRPLHTYVHRHGYSTEEAEGWQMADFYGWRITAEMAA